MSKGAKGPSPEALNTEILKARERVLCTPTTQATCLSSLHPYLQLVPLKFWAVLLLFEPGPRRRTHKPLLSVKVGQGGGWPSLEVMQGGGAGGRDGEWTPNGSSLWRQENEGCDEGSAKAWLENPASVLYTKRPCRGDISL